MNFGLNILAHYVRDMNALLEWVDRAKPAAMLVMDDPALAASIKRRLPQAAVVHRTYSANDKNWHDRRADGTWVFPPARWIADHAPTARDGVIVQVFNEPVPVDVDAFLRWIEELIRACPADVALGLCAFAVGNPHENDIRAGRYDRLIRLIANTRHKLILHEYFRADAASESPWLCGRFEFWDARASALGFADFARRHIIIGEHGRDVGGGRNDGWRGQGWSEATYFDKLVRAQAIYRPRGVPVCIFSYGYGANNDWLSFDVQDARALLGALARYNEEHPMTYPTLPTDDDPRWMRARASANGAFVNVRSTPVVDGVRNKIGEIRKDTLIDIITDDAAGWRVPEGVWRPIRLLEPERIGWARDDVFSYTLLSGAPTGAPVRRRLNVAVSAANLRSTPTIWQTNIVGQVANGSIVDVIFPQPPQMGGGYEWAWVMSGDKAGWMARTRATWSEQFLDAGAQKLIDVPYASQWGWASRRTGMCGAASAWMVIADDKRQRGLKMPAEITVDTIADYLGLKANSFTRMGDLARALVAYGVNAVWTNGMTLERVIEEIDAGYPAICLGQYSHLTGRADQQFGGGHILVAVGYTDSAVICNDPDYAGNAGRHVHYPRDEFARFLRDTSESGNSPNQGILIRYWGFPLLP